VRIDHVIWKAADLDRGGRRVGLGTHNRVFPLGGGYLEVLAVADPQEAARSPLGRTIVDAPEGLFGWAVAVDDVDAHADRLSLEVTTIAREDLTACLADAERLESWLGGADLPLRLADDDGPRGLRALVLGSGLVIS
jgi:Glyoxalase-like domain